MSKALLGLSEDEVVASREKYGSNELKKTKTKGFFRKLLENLNDPIIRILIIALGLQVLFTFGNCNYLEIFGIIFAIFIATFVSTLSELGSEKAFSKIENESRESLVTVFRGGLEKSIPIAEVVVGDVIKLRSGEKIAADGYILSGEISTDQSALNGENREVKKTVGTAGGSFDLSSDTKAFRGSVIVDGEGWMKVERVGDKTFYGMVARDVQSETRESPLKLRLSKLAGQISKIGYIIAALVGFTFLFNRFFADNGFVWNRIVASFCDLNFTFTSIVKALTLMITVVVVAVPEGLPMMITVVLSANMKRMIRDNILVKKLVGIETAGSLNILFTDKTGTLTTGKLSVDTIITDKAIYRSALSMGKDNEIRKLLELNAIYNTDTVVTDGEIIGGNSTDRAIRAFFLNESFQVLTVKDKTPFKSEKKYSSVTLSNGLTLYKGAPEVIFSDLRLAVGPRGERIASDLRFVKRQYSEAIERGERVIAVSVSEDGGVSRAFLGLIILKDKIRPGVKEAVDTVMRAGIQIVMVTGDNKDTAVSIAAECGFFKESAGHLALTSGELSEMTDEQVKTVIPRIRVLARALPQDKTRLVRLSQELDLVTGMTGDGINDAPSLKLSDVGFAMGSGTDIAKAAGDIVILDDSFGSICRTVLYGRTIFKSIRKFITFQLIMNLAACGITLIGQFLGIESPITIIQMLWVNIIMDTLGGLAFAGEAPLDYYMKEKPKRRDEPILSKEMISHVLLNGSFTLCLLLFFLRSGRIAAFYGTTGRLLCAFYALFIFCGIINSVSARCERLLLFNNIGKNKPFIFIMLLITVIQILIVYYGGQVFRSMPLTLRELLTVVIFSLSVLVFDTVRRIAVKLSA
jgi:calcium-translocating P-type ATPase